MLNKQTTTSQYVLISDIVKGDVIAFENEKWEVVEAFREKKPHSSPSTKLVLKDHKYNKRERHIYFDRQIRVLFHIDQG